jgi:putative NADPH-quinone reductase
MRVLVLYAHPVETSYNAALHARAIDGLRAAGHAVDDCDLYAEGFDPVLSRDERLNYHNPRLCRKPVERYVARLLAAEALVLIFPVWNFGYPAILKGFFDRVFLPGVSFDLLEDGSVRGRLNNIRKVAAIVTYGGSRLRAMLAGDPPRKTITRVLRGQVGWRTPIAYLAHYGMNDATLAQRERFLARVSQATSRF